MFRTALTWKITPDELIINFHTPHPLIELTVYNLSHLICISHNPQVSAFLKPPMLGVVLQTYGSGNAPNNRDDLISEIKNATRRGVLIINCTQCLHGPVVDQYATGKVRVLHINVYWYSLRAFDHHVMLKWYTIHVF